MRTCSDKYYHAFRSIMELSVGKSSSINFFAKIDQIVLHRQADHPWQSKFIPQCLKRMKQLKILKSEKILFPLRVKATQQKYRKASQIENLVPN